MTGALYLWSDWAFSEAVPMSRPPHADTAPYIRARELVRMYPSIVSCVAAGFQSGLARCSGPWLTEDRKRSRESAAVTSEFELDADAADHRRNDRAHEPELPWRVDRAVLIVDRGCHVGVQGVEQLDGGVEAFVASELERFRGTHI